MNIDEIDMLIEGIIIGVLAITFFMIGFMIVRIINKKSKYNHFIFRQ